jgi:hypothetical protein
MSDELQLQNQALFAEVRSELKQQANDQIAFFFDFTRFAEMIHLIALNLHYSTGSHPQVLYSANRYMYRSPFTGEESPTPLLAVENPLFLGDFRRAFVSSINIHSVLDILENHLSQYEGFGMDTEKIRTARAIFRSLLVYDFNDEEWFILFGNEIYREKTQVTIERWCAILEKAVPLQTLQRFIMWDHNCIYSFETAIRETLLVYSLECDYFHPSEIFFQRALPAYRNALDTTKESELFNNMFSALTLFLANFPGVVSDILPMRKSRV